MTSRKSTTGEKIADALFQVLTEADHSEIETILQAMQELKEKHPQTLAGIRRQPFARHIVDAIVEAVNYCEGPK